MLKFHTDLLEGEYFRAMLRFDGASTAQHRELVLSESITPQALGVLLEFFYTDR